MPSSSDHKGDEEYADGEHCSAGDPCSVCRTEFEAEEEVLELPCGHCFHDECIKPWLEVQNTCPICRATLPSTGNQANATGNTAGRQPGVQNQNNQVPGVNPQGGINQLQQQLTANGLLGGMPMGLFQSPTMPPGFMHHINPGQPLSQNQNPDNSSDHRDQQFSSEIGRQLDQVASFADRTRTVDPFTIPQLYFGPNDDPDPLSEFNAEFGISHQDEDDLLAWEERVAGESPLPSASSGYWPNYQLQNSGEMRPDSSTWSSLFNSAFHSSSSNPFHQLLQPSPDPSRYLATSLPTRETLILFILQTLQAIIRPFTISHAWHEVHVP